MQRYQILVEYVGTNFVGWQIQKKGNSIQKVIQSILSRLLKQKIIIYGSGRTDAGVHALGQTAHINLPPKLSVDELLQAINGNLGQDVRIDQVEETKDDFHARFSATSREYEYHMVKNYSPLTRNYAAELKWDINQDLLNECARILLGNHDFTSFCKATAEVEKKSCVINSASWKESKEMLIFKIKANRFLHHMVRYLVGTSLEVARGRYSIKDFNDLLNNVETDILVVRAPAKGLFLKLVTYD